MSGAESDSANDFSDSEDEGSDGYRRGETTVASLLLNIPSLPSSCVRLSRCSERGQSNLLRPVLMHEERCSLSIAISHVHQLPR